MLSFTFYYPSQGFWQATKSCYFIKTFTDIFSRPLTNIYSYSLPVAFRCMWLWTGSVQMIEIVW